MTIIALNNNVMLSVLKTLGLLDIDTYKFKYSLEIKYETDTEYVYFIIYCFFNNEFVVFSKIRIHTEEFEKIETNETSISIMITSEYIQKILLLLKWYPKNILFIGLDFNVVNITTDECSFCKIMYSFDDIDIIEPVLLRHTCIIETDSLKKIFELCIINGQCISLEINNDILCISNFDKTIKCAVGVTDNKKIKLCIVLRHEYLQFLLNRIMTIKSKTCNLYISKELPFVIEDSDTCNRIYIAPKE